MKILMLNPHVDAAHGLAKAFEQRGDALLLPADPTEARQMLQLHGDTVELAAIHLEGPGKQGEPGLELLGFLKGDPTYRDIPVILTTESWDVARCEEHQQSDQGANAYLQHPYGIEDFFQLFDQVLGANVDSDDGAIDLSIPTAASFQPGDEDSLAPSAEVFEITGAGDESILNLDETPAVDVPAAVDAPAAVDVPEMPYLFRDQSAASHPSEPEISPFAQAMGDAVVPGGAAQAPDIETLKKYLLLREQDVAALSSQLHSARNQLARVEDELKHERASKSDLQHQSELQEKKISEFEQEKQLALGGFQAEIRELRFQVKAKTDKAKILEKQVHDAQLEMDKIRERVRNDIRKIRVRERELENRLEIVRKDAEALLAARENKIIELKRKLDLLEFNMDLLQDRYNREKDTSGGLRDRLAKAAQALRVAGGVLDLPRLSEDFEAELVGEGSEDSTKAVS